ncbi:MAG: type I asparaginase [Prevotella sp.]|nr:type I asparaginase [Prevotella sp.]
MTKSKVLLIYTGGTIGMKRNRETGALEPFDFDQLLSRMPELQELPVETASRQFDPPIDSSDMSPRLWTELAGIIANSYADYDGFVILHGTDTMAYTASALSFLLEGLTKPVILTGSQLPIGQLRTDGKENIITAIEIAATRKADGTARVPEVCIYFNGHLMRGNRTTKLSADDFNAFESFNYPHLADAGVNIIYHDEHFLKPLTVKGDLQSPPPLLLDDNVIIFSLFPGVREDLIRHIIDTPQLKSIVMRTFGSGNAPHSQWLMDTLREGTRRGLVIVNVSQCLRGCVEMGRYAAGHQLQEAGVVSGYDATVEATVTKLMYLQARYDDPQTVRQLMERSIRGEISES